jgi:hypothetical protein
MYLGEAYFFRTSGYGHIQMRDKEHRDMPMFLERNPAFSAGMFVKEIPRIDETF